MKAATGLMTVLGLALTITAPVKAQTLADPPAATAPATAPTAVAVPKPTVKVLNEEELIATLVGFRLKYNQLSNGNVVTCIRSFFPETQGEKKVEITCYGKEGSASFTFNDSGFWFIDYYTSRDGSKKPMMCSKFKKNDNNSCNIYENKNGQIIMVWPRGGEPIISLTPL